MTTKSIFIGSPGDLAAERRIVEQVVRELQSSALHVLAAARWEALDALTATTGQQLQIQPLLDRADVLVCMFGERVGVPLPAPPDFMLPEHFDLPPSVRWPWPHDGDDAAHLPLTGSIYELLHGRHSGKPTLVLIKAGSNPFIKDAPPEQRHLGGGAWLAHLEAQARKQGASRPTKAVRDDYDRQTEWVCRLIDHFFVSRGDALHFTDGDELRRKLSAKLRAVLGLSTRARTSPVKGLAFYDLDDAASLHGRSRKLRAVLDDLARVARTDACLVLLHGRSGAGKSSFLRAGLAHALASGQREDQLGRLVGCVVRPGDWQGKTPFAGLADGLRAALAAAGGGAPWSADEQTLWERAERASGAQQLVARTLAALDGVRLFLAIDQLEEILAVLTDADEAPQAAQWDAFIVAIGALAHSGRVLFAATLPDEWIVVLDTDPRVAGLRAAFARADGGALPRVAAWIDAPSDDDVREIVEQTFAQAGMPPDAERLTGLLDEVRELRKRGDAFLPLLSLAMTRHVEQWQARSTEHRRAPFAAIAAPSDAPVSLRALIDEIAESCVRRIAHWDTDAIVARLLRRVVRFASDGAEERIALRAASLAALPGPCRELAAALAQARLAVVSDGQVRLVHEALLVHWQRAAQWTDRNARDLRMASTFAELARQWMRAGNHPRWLLRADTVLDDASGATITQGDAEALYGRWSRDLDPPVRAFRSASLLDDVAAEPPDHADGTPRLACAVLAGDAQLVARWLGAGADPDRLRPADGFGPLAAAIEHDDPELAVALIAAGADLGFAWRSTWNPLNVVCWQGAERCLDVVIDTARGRGELDSFWEALGAQLDGGGSPLMAAARAGHARLLARMLALPVVAAVRDRVLSSTDPEGWSALMVAADEGHAEVIEVLLTAAGDPQAQRMLLLQTTRGGINALQAATMRGRREAVATLLARAAESATRFEMVRHHDERGAHALLYAAANGHTELIAPLVAALDDARDRVALLAAGNSEGWTPLLVAAENDRVATLHALLAIAPDAALRRRMLLHAGPGAWTALISAAANGRVPLIAVLVDAAEALGVRAQLLRAADQQGVTAMIAAAVRGHAEALGALVAATRDADERTALLTQAADNGWTALMFAASRGDMPCAAALLDAAANATARQRLLDQQTATGAAALDLAAEGAHAPVVRLLLGAASDPAARRAMLDRKGQGGRTALMQAALHADRATIDACILGETDRDVRKHNLFQRDDGGATALLIGASAGRADVCDALLSALADDAERAALVQLGNGDQQTPLMYAAFGSHATTVACLIAALTDPHERAAAILTQDLAGGTALLAAASAGDADSARLLLEALPDRAARRAALEHRSPTDGTPLDAARRLGHRAAPAYLEAQLRELDELE